MFENFGQKIRSLREQKGISLNQFAKNLNVSPAYLSNLETGQRTKVDLDFLHRIEKELNIVSTEFRTTPQNEFNDFYYRAEKVFEELVELERDNSLAAKYWLDMLEKGIQLYHSEQHRNTNSKEYH